MKTKLIFSFFFIIFGVAMRLFMVKFIKIPNLEIVTSFSLISGAILGGIFTLIIPLSIIAVTDMYIGNTSILLFTWSAFALIGVFGWVLRDRKSFNFSFVFEMTGMGILASLFFYLYTNLGWWLLSDMYSHTFEGLVHCYIMGLPFFKTNLLGNLFFVPFFTFFVLTVEKCYLGSKVKLLSLLKFKYDSLR